MYCPQCKNYIPSGIAFETCPSCDAPIESESVTQKESLPRGASSDVVQEESQHIAWPKFDRDEIVNNFKSKLPSYETKSTKYWAPLRWLFVSWALTWRAVLLPSFGLFLFYMVVIYGLAVLGVDTTRIHFMRQYEVLLYFPFYLFLFEWASNVILRKIYQFESRRFLGWALYWRWQVLYWGVFLFLVPRLSIPKQVPDWAIDYLVDAIIGFILGLWAMLIFSKEKSRIDQAALTKKPGDTPLPLMRKVLWFIPGLYLLLIMTLLIAFTVGVGLIVGIYVAEARAGGRIHVGILAMIAAGVFGAFAAVFMAIGKILNPKPNDVMATKLNLDGHPKFKAMIEELAHLTGTRMPEAVLIDSQCEFSVQNSFLSTLAGKVKGRVLTISAPLLRLLNVNELKGILAHEFAHFSGNDAAFSNRVQPVYTITSSAVQDMKKASKASKWAEIPLLLPVSLLTKYLEEFHRIYMRISRAREYRSDAIAAKIVGKNVFSNALYKVHVASGLFSRVLTSGDEKSKLLGTNPDNFYEDFYETLTRKGSLIRQVGAEVLEAGSGEDIYSSHPSFEARVSNIEEFEDKGDDAEPALNLFGSAREWEVSLTQRLRPVVGMARAQNVDAEKRRYTVAIDDTKKIREDKRFLAELAQSLKMGERNILDLCDKFPSLRINALTMERAEGMINLASRYTKKIRVEIDAEATAKFLEVNDFIKPPKDEDRREALKPAATNLAEQQTSLLCRLCGSGKNVSYRAYLRIYSVIVYTAKNHGAVNPICHSCRIKAGLPCTFFSLIFGWWGFPWGPIWTIQSIIQNFKGGLVIPMEGQTDRGANS